ncbi:MAG: bifunctional demethylmenaquinone methyltransferase/2-methoxy-6-polyprenyl-1,4-benzoquinol methylase UbiE [Azospirillum sp.]|nr:bifunctional demethylmenaquinone methyltransferase/2-methoxy-6-polyprenyl-1,4-benzoquinol methylase UbiE [Azospirillum sp.]
MTDETTHFGFREVPVAEKAKRVRAVFDSVAARYDLMNDLMSAGVHRLWKRAFVHEAAPRAGEAFLDLAGGTGDIAFALDDARARVRVCDINEAMLRQGRARAMLRKLDWVTGDAMALPFAPATFDAATIAFGLRNVTDPDAALREIRRVLKPGGRFLCLEFSHVALPLLDKLYDVYSFSVLPRLGAWVAGDADSYRYLAESIRRFPPQAELARRMTQAGFARVRWRNLSGGIVAIHSGWRT